jgi:hypothetical protein
VTNIVYSSNTNTLPAKSTNAVQMGRGYNRKFHVGPAR